MATAEPLSEGAMFVTLDSVRSSESSSSSSSSSVNFHAEDETSGGAPLSFRVEETAGSIQIETESDAADGDNPLGAGKPKGKAGGRHKKKTDKKGAKDKSKKKGEKKGEKAHHPRHKKHATEEDKAAAAALSEKPGRSHSPTSGRYNAEARQRFLATLERPLLVFARGGSINRGVEETGSQTGMIGGGVAPAGATDVPDIVRKQPRYTRPVGARTANSLPSQAKSSNKGGAAAPPPPPAAPTPEAYHVFRQQHVDPYPGSITPPQRHTSAGSAMLGYSQSSRTDGHGMKYSTSESYYAHRRYIPYQPAAVRNSPRRGSGSNSRDGRAAMPVHRRSGSVNSPLRSPRGEVTQGIRACTPVTVSRPTADFRLLAPSEPVPRLPVSVEEALAQHYEQGLLQLPIAEIERVVAAIMTREADRKTVLTYLKSLRGRPQQQSLNSPRGGRSRSPLRQPPPPPSSGRASRRGASPERGAPLEQPRWVSTKKVAPGDSWASQRRNPVGHPGALADRAPNRRREVSKKSAVDEFHEQFAAEARAAFLEDCGAACHGRRARIYAEQPRVARDHGAIIPEEAIQPYYEQTVERLLYRVLGWTEQESRRYSPTIATIVRERLPSMGGEGEEEEEEGAEAYPRPFHPHDAAARVTPPAHDHHAQPLVLQGHVSPQEPIAEKNEEAEAVCTYPPYGAADESTRDPPAEVVAALAAAAPHANEEEEQQKPPQPTAAAQEEPSEPAEEDSENKEVEELAVEAEAHPEAQHAEDEEM